MKKAYAVYVDDGTVTMKIDVPAESKKKAMEYVQGNGEVIAIKEGTRTAENPISMDYIIDALRRSNFGETEIALISRALQDCEFIS